MERTLSASLFLFALAGACPADAEPPRAYVYRSPGHAGGSDGALSGSAVAHNGDWLVVGMPGQDDQGLDVGAVAVYRWQDGRWRHRLPWLTLSALDGGLDAQDGARFGASVALSGDRVLIGCPGCSSPNPRGYLVELTEPWNTQPDWHPLYPALMSVHDAEFGIGAAVALSGATLAISAPNARSTPQGVERGAVALGHFDGSNVVWDDIVFGPADSPGSRFGHALAMTTTPGSTLFEGVRSLVVGAPAYVNSGGFGLAGRAYLYEQESFFPGPWALVQEFDNPSPGIADALGWSVAIDREHLNLMGHVALGAPGATFTGTPGGTVRVYRRAVLDSTYSLEGILQHPDAASGDRFGISVGVDGGRNARVLVGADRRAVGSHPDEGTVYVFDRELDGGGFRWEWRQSLEFPGAWDTAFGRSLSMSRNMVVVGQPEGPQHGGSVSVFVCDQLFFNGMESAAEACEGP